MLKLIPSSFHWRMRIEDERTGANILQKACDVINNMTDTQKAAVELYVRSERKDAFEEGYAEGEMDG